MLATFACFLGYLTVTFILHWLYSPEELSGIHEDLDSCNNCLLEVVSEIGWVNYGKSYKTKSLSPTEIRTEYRLKHIYSITATRTNSNMKTFSSEYITRCKLEDAWNIDSAINR
jgi:hypothetical protein